MWTPLVDRDGLASRWADMGDDRKSRARLLIAGGIGALGVLWLGELPARATGDFRAHMWLHMMVVALAAPLVGIGLNGVSMAQHTSRWRLGAVGATVIEFVVVWGWHTPALHHWARSATLGLAAEQSTFFLSSLLVWRAAFRPNPLAAAEGIVALLLTSMHITLLGALLALAPRAVYAHGVAEVDAATLLAQQHMGGVTMLLIGGAVYLLGGLWLMARLLAPLDRGSRSVTAPDGFSLASKRRS